MTSFTGECTIVSDEFTRRIGYLRTQGYDIRTISLPGDRLQLRVTKGNIKAARMFSMDELKTANIDLFLYTLERMVEKIDEYKENKNEH